MSKNNEQFNLKSKNVTRNLSQNVLQDLFDSAREKYKRYQNDKNSHTYCTVNSRPLKKL